MKTAPKLYVGTMNDGAFIIDQPPHPESDIIDHSNGPAIVIPLGSDFDLAHKLVAAWNGVLDAA